MSTVAKLVNELEGLLAVKELHDVEYCGSGMITSSGSERICGWRPGRAAASAEGQRPGECRVVSADLQLGSAPETLVEAIDTVVAETVEAAGLA